MAFITISNPIPPPDAFVEPLWSQYWSNALFRNADDWLDILYSFRVLANPTQLFISANEINGMKARLIENIFSVFIDSPTILIANLKTLNYIIVHISITGIVVLYEFHEHLKYSRAI